MVETLGVKDATALLEYVPDVLGEVDIERLAVPENCALDEMDGEPVIESVPDTDALEVKVPPAFVSVVEEDADTLEE